MRDDPFSGEFDNAPTDAQRLGHLPDVWKHNFDDGRTSRPGSPLRLLMGSVEGTDPGNHRFGPDARKIAAEWQSLDQTVGNFTDRALDLWNGTRARPTVSTSCRAATTLRRRGGRRERSSTSAGTGA